MRLILLTSFFLSIFCLNAVGQNEEETQRILTQIAEEENDSLKMEFYDDLLKSNESSDSITFNLYYGEAMQFAREINSIRGEAYSMYRKSVNYHHLSKGSNQKTILINLTKQNSHKLYEWAKEHNYTEGEALGIEWLGYIELNQHNSIASIKLYDKAILLNTKNNDRFGLYVNHFNNGRNYKNLQNYDSSLHHYFKALEYASNLKDTVELYYEIAVVYANNKEYELSQQYTNDINDLLAELNDSQFSIYLYRQIGIKYFKFGFYDLAIAPLEKSIALSKESNDFESISFAYYWIALCYAVQEEHINAIRYLQQSINAYSDDTSDFSLHYYYIGRAYLKLDQLDSVQKYYEIITFINKDNPEHTRTVLNILKANLQIYSGELDSALVTINSEIPLPKPQWGVPNFCDLYNSKAKIHSLKKEYHKSIQSYQKVINAKDNMTTPDLALEPLKGLSDNHKAIGDYEAALTYFTQYISLKDSLQNSKNSNRLAELEFDNFNTQQELAHQKQLDQENKTQIIILIVSILLFMLLAILLKYYRSKVKSTHKIELQKEQLELLNKEKNKVIGVIAHDLRSPLNSIKGLINIFHLEKDESEKERFIDLVALSADRMADMVNRVLDVSALESKKLDLRSEKINLVELLNQLVTSFQLSAKKKQQNIVLQTQCTEAIVELDKNYLIQVIENLVSNALKYSNPNTTTTLSLVCLPQSAKLTVIDQGPGISTEEQKLLFKEFSTLSSKTTGGEKATGLGLSIVKKYVEAMKGKIWCESEPGMGSSFVLEFSLNN